MRLTISVSAGMALLVGCPDDARGPGPPEEIEREPASGASASGAHTGDPPSEEKRPVADAIAAAERLPELSPERAAELRKQYLAKLDEGRGLTKAGKYAEGITRYLEALALDPSDSTTLAELGWAALLSDQLELARKTTTRALELSREDKAKGMLLYNLGRIAEAEGDLTAAIDHYQRSLEHRENRTVKKRLEAVSKAVAVVPPTRGGGLGRVASGLPDLEAVCEALQKHDACNWSKTTDEERCGCDASLEGTPPGDPTQGFFAIETHMQKSWFPTIRTADGWTVFELAVWAYNPGAFGIFEDVRLETPRVGEPLSDGVPTMIWTFDRARSDRDMGLNEIEFDSSRSVVVCARKNAEAWCTAPLVQRATYGREIEFPDHDDADVEHTEGVPYHGSYEAELEIAGGKLVISNPRISKTGSGVSIEGAHPPGEYDLDVLLGRKSE